MTAEELRELASTELGLDVVGVEDPSVIRNLILAQDESE